MSLAVLISRDFPQVLNVLFIPKVNFEKDPVLPIEKFPSLVLFRMRGGCKTLLFNLCSIIGQVVAYGRQKQTKISNLSSKSDRGRLREVFAYITRGASTSASGWG